MKLRVMKYQKDQDAYDCRDEENKWHLVDFHVCGSPAIKPAYYDREKLIGKIVTVDYLQPHLELVRFNPILNQKAII